MSISLSDFLDDDNPFDSTDLKKPVIPDLSTGEIDALESQVSELSTFLQSLTRHCEQRKERYTQYLNDLMDQIDRAKSVCEEQYGDLVFQQEAELADLIAVQKNELAQIVIQKTGIDASSAEWEKLTKELESVRTALEESNIRVKITRTQQEQRELAIMRASRRSEAQMKEAARSLVQAGRLEALQEEIAQLAAVQREQRRVYDNVMSECVAAQNTIARVHDGLIETLQEEAGKRGAIFAKHLEIVRKQLAEEERRLENDAKAAQALVAEYTHIQKVTNRRCAKQLQKAVDDINAIEALVNQDVREEENDKGSISSMTKNQTAERENCDLEQQVKYLEAELAALKGQIANATAALKNARTPRPAVSSRSYSAGSPFRFS
jgi:predicted  nucleic acid-binding Zn-ribbon protein